MNALLSVFVGLAVSAPVFAGLTGGILGDVDDNGRVDMMDGVWVTIYSKAPSFAFPDQVNISLGDINADDRIDSTDVRLIATYISNPSDPALPSGIGQPFGEACSVGLELSPGQSCIVDTVDIPNTVHISSNRFKVKADGRGYYNRFEKRPGVSRINDISSSSRIDTDGFQASPIKGTSKWRIDALP